MLDDGDRLKLLVAIELLADELLGEVLRRDLSA